METGQPKNRYIAPENFGEGFTLGKKEVDEMQLRAQQIEAEYAEEMKKRSAASEKAKEKSSETKEKAA